MCAGPCCHLKVVAEEEQQHDTVASVVHTRWLHSDCVCYCCAGLPVPDPPARPCGHTPPGGIRGEAGQKCEARDVGHTFLCEPGLHSAAGGPVHHAAVITRLPHDVLCTPERSTAPAPECVGQTAVCDGDVCGWLHRVVEQQRVHGVGQLGGPCGTTAECSCAMMMYPGVEGEAASPAAFSHGRQLGYVWRGRMQERVRPQSMDEQGDTSGASGCCFGV
jgi:hypothetical protein